MDFWLQRALNEIDSATDGITAEQLGWHPAEGKWSAAQILGHLSLAYHHTVAGLARVLRNGKPIAGKGTLKQWIATRVVADLGYFPSGRPAPAMTLPTDVSAAQIVGEIHQNLIAMDAILVEVEQKLGPAVKVADHPVLGPFRVEEWRKFHYRHTHHHMKQVRAIREKQSLAASR